MSGQKVPERRLHDAVIIVPGIMGSALRDVESGKQLWGVRRLFEYSARMHGRRLRELAVSDEERTGRTGRVEPTGLLNIAESMPGLGQAQPYNHLVSELRDEALHRSAVLAFPYDWRLSVEHNGGCSRPRPVGTSKPGVSTPPTATTSAAVPRPDRPGSSSSPTPWAGSSFVNFSTAATSGPTSARS